MSLFDADMREIRGAEVCAERQTCAVRAPHVRGLRKAALTVFVFSSSRFRPQATAA
jgi:hypothetical protein